MSVVFGLAVADIAAVVAEAHDLAVDAALGYLERHATWTRRGEVMVASSRSEGNGLVAAAFRHRTSRAGDPHLHTHVLVANAVRGTDGRWSTVDARHFYWHSKTAGYLYEAHLRSELTARLGVRWTKAIKGIADIEGVPRRPRHLLDPPRRDRGAARVRRPVVAPSRRDRSTDDPQGQAARRST